MSDDLKSSVGIALEGSSVIADLPGFYKTDADSHQYAELGWMFDMFARGQVLRSIPKFVSWCFSGSVLSTLRSLDRVSHSLEVHDARLLEVSQGLSKAQFFDKYGFVLLDHKSQMSAADWIESGESFQVDDVAKSGEEQATYNMEAQTPAKKIYASECEEMVRELFPSARDFFLPGMGARRGPDFYNLYAMTLHADYPMDFDLAAEKNPWADLKRQREAFLASDIKEFYQVNFWRPVLPMQGPVKAHPLCFLDPNTVREEDIVLEETKGQIAGGQAYLTLKHHSDQQFYYYPEMTTDEVLLFKNAHYRKGESVGDMPIFHSAFEHPETTKKTEPRLSFEYRVGFFV
jgi:hypothetical protein